MSTSLFTFASVRTPFVVQPCFMSSNRTIFSLSPKICVKEPVERDIEIDWLAS